MSLRCWLVKTEPFKYSFTQLLKDRKTVWDGVRNFEARNYLRAMSRGDHVLVYHSNEGKEVVGVARVAKTAYPDPTATEGDWSVIELAGEYGLLSPVSLETLRTTPELKGMVLHRRNRLSVTPVTAEEFLTILRLGIQEPLASPASAAVAQSAETKEALSRTLAELRAPSLTAKEPALTRAVPTREPPSTKAAVKPSTKKTALGPKATKPTGTTQPSTKRVGEPTRGPRSLSHDDHDVTAAGRARAMAGKPAGRSSAGAARVQTGSRLPRQAR